MDIKDLEKLGLNGNEAKVYYSLLKVGSSTASELVKNMGIHRNIIYDNLEKLIEKGLVSYIIEESKKVFSAQEPNALVEFLDKKKQKVENEINFAKGLLPSIERLRKERAIKQEAQIFRGIKGMKKVLLEVLKEKENLILGMTDKSTEFLGETYWKNYNAKIKHLKIKERLLLNSDFKEIYNFEKNKNIKIKILPSELNQLTETILFGGKVAIFIYSEKPLVFLIEDENIYQTYL